QYAVLGPYDFVNVVEAPDNETIAKVSMELGSRGTVQIMTLPALPIETFTKKAKGK
ncbi:MAG: GYD domain-containing protein, partial [candidate division NC10 bacterium]|nr:GYD domain-containing protein [candidate division NC10 bacterium]